MKVHQLWMDVIGNNIANVNTIGFKLGQASFQDALCQTMRGASATTNVTGGSDPMQVGLGVKLAAISNVFTQGSLQVTGKMTDLSIQGEGFFILSDSVGDYYTRAGAMSFDSAGKFVNPANGFQVQGWMANAAGVIDTNAKITGISIPVGRTMPPRATDGISYRGNLPSTAATGATSTTSIAVRDSQGGTHDVSMTFTKTAVPNAWTWAVSGPAGIVGNGTVTFNTSGLVSAATTLVGITFPPPGAAVVAITADFGTLLSTESLTQYATDSTVAAVSQTGFGSGDLQNISISESGIITGFFSNGRNQQLAQVAVCTFNNPGALMKAGDSMWRSSNNSGQPLVGAFATGSRGNLTAGALEMSNVDLAQEFTNLISAQRGFQANTRIISTVDQVLADVVQLKR